MISRLAPVLLLLAVITATGCSAIPKPVPTLWHKFGIPQAAARIKDRRANRKGLKPEKERKPKLKRLADPANLAPEAPKMIQVAAEIKQAEDLAPQKVKALLYLGKVGCGCYNKAGEVEKALIKGLVDCTPEVRKAALQAIQMSACGSCSCNGDGCNGSVCCTKKVVAQLKKMAYEQDDQGCYYETSAEVRSMAESTLNACPPLPFEPEPEELPEPKRPEQLPEPKVNKSIDEPKDDEDSDNSIPEPDDVRRRSNNPYRQVGVRQNNRRTDEVDTSKLIDAVVEQIDANTNQMLIRFSNPYLLPVGSKLVVASDEHNVTYCNVIASETGAVVVTASTPEYLQRIAPSQFVMVGITR